MRRTMTTSGQDDYLALVKKCPLTRIRSDAQHKAALRTSGRLVGLDRRLTGGERQYLDALVVLIREYERSCPELRLRKVKGLDVLRHLMAEHKMPQKKLAELLDVGESAASMILAGKRELTKSHVRRLARHFGVGAGAFFA